MLCSIIEVDMEMEKGETSVHWCRIHQKDFNTEGHGKGTFVRFSSRWKERIQSNMIQLDQKHAQDQLGDMHCTI